MCYFDSHEGKKYSTCLQNVAEWEYRVAENGNTQIPENCT